MARSAEELPEIARGTSKRERILRAAIEVFAQSGYFNAKVSDIAKVAGVADGTIYLYFDGKEDVLISIFREHTQNFLENLEKRLADVKTPEERLRVAMRHQLEALGRDRALAVVFQVELRHSLKFMTLFSQEEVADYLNILRAIVEQGQTAGTFRKSLHPMLVAKAIFGILDEMVTSWILSEKEQDLPEQSDALADLVLGGLKA